MKILHFHWRYDRYGGGERYLFDLLRGLEEKGHEVVVVSSGSQDNYRSRKRREYFIEGSFGVKSGLKMWKVVRDIICKEDPDVIHFHETLCFLSPYIIMRLARIKPTVQTLHTAFFFARRVPRYCPTMRYATTPWEECAWSPAVLEEQICD